MTTATPEDGTLQRLLDDEIEPFLEHLRAACYADETVRQKRAIAAEFAQWAQQHTRNIEKVDEPGRAGWRKSAFTENLDAPALIGRRKKRALA